VTAREDADPGPLTDTASVTWRDANDSPYGPVSASFSTQVIPNLESAVQLGSTTITPQLVSTVSPDQQSGAPGDTVHYAITVANDGSSLALGATTSARYTGSGTGTVAAASVALETHDATTGSWQPLASWQIHQGGYTPAVAPSAGGLTVEASPQPAGGVSYPPTARNVLGTSVASGSTAAWAIFAKADLDQAQSRRLLSSVATDAARVSVRFELVDDAGRRVAGKTQRLDVTADVRTQSGHARGATVEVDLPDGSVQTIGQQTAPALADLALGDSASFGVAGGRPAPGGKTAGESDQDYLQRLQDADETNVFAAATPSAMTDGGGSRDATGQLSQGPVRSFSGAAGRGGVRRVVPVVSLADVGPASSSPGGHLTYVVTAANTGHLAASTIDLRDEVNGAAATAMPGGPQVLPAGGSAQTQRDADVPIVQSAGSFTHTATVTWHDGQGNTYGPVSDAAATQIVAADIPTAPVLDLSGVTGVDEANAFLTQGSDPTQTGLTSGTISPIRASVIRGQLLDRDAGPIAGAAVTVVGHPEYGQATTRSDGGIFMLVNAGLPLRLRFHKGGYLDAERDVSPRAQDYTWIDDVALVHEEQASTGIDLGLAAPAQVARGAAETDSSGTRQATLVFQPGTTASLQMPDGSTQPVSHLTLHVTEFTVGPRGPEAMPADLPPTSGYTYAAAFNADEVAAAGASGVSCSTPVAGYVENFVGFPVGDTVPSGSYDPAKGTWVPSTSGRVIKILSITNGMADLDTTGSGQPASAAQLAALGITDAERAQLATLYPAGRVLWRVPMSHFSLWDWNWWTGFPSGASGPPGGAPDGGGPGPDGCGQHCSDPSACVDQGGSSIECENQILHEDADVQGTGMALDYSSGRQPGRAIDRTVTVPISGASPPSSLKRIEIQVDVAGQHTEFTRGIAPNQSFTYTWDGRDGYGRRVQGAAKALVRIGYVYDLVYGGGSPQFGDAATSSYSVNARSEGTVWRDVNLTLGGIDERLAGIGGWSLSDHHSYDPVSRTLYMGDGSVRTAGSVNAAISTLTTLTGRDWPAYGVLAAPDGSVYFSANSVIRRLLPDGTYQTVAGTPGTTGFAGDGGPATSALVAGARGLALGPDGSLYFADSGNNRVRRINPSGIITTIAGNGQTNPGLAGDGGPATQAVIDYPTAVKVASDGTVYIAEVGPTYCCNNGLVRKVDANGRITTVAGRLDRTGTSVIEGQSATSAYFDYLSDLALAPDGSIIVADANHCRIRRIDTSGRVYTIAGTSPSGTQVACGSDGNGGPATSAHIDHPYWLALAPDGSIYFRETDHRIRKVNPDGTIANVAGTGVSGLSGDGGPATQAKIWGPEGLTIDAAGNVIFVDFYNQRLRKISPPLPGFTGTDLAIPSTDGSELYRFDEHGRHLATVDTHTAKTLETFSYDDRGHLTGITDLDGDTVTIAYALNGSPTSITGPFGQQTRLHVDASGYLDAITDNAGNQTRVHYQPGGLMDSITSPAGHTAHMSWTSLGLLSTDSDADGVSKTYTRADRSGGRTVTTTTALGHTKTNSYDVLADGTVHRAITGYDGLTATLDLRPDGSRTASDPSGAVATYSLGGDPRFGMNAPLVSNAGLTTPGGRHLTTSTTRQVTLANALDPLSLQTETETTTINGRSATATYTAAQRKLTVTSAGGRAASVTYDANGRPQTDHIDGVLDVSTSYDSHGRPSGVIQGSRSESYTYDASGRPDTETDAAGRVTSFAWDAADRLTALTLPDGRQIDYTYDADGNLTSITPPGRPSHSFTSTPAGRGQDATAPAAPGGGSGTHLHYDSDGQLVRVTRPDNQDIIIGRDSAGRVSTITRPEGGAVTYHYSPTTGQLASVDSPDGETVSYAYDGPLTTSSTFSSPVAGTVTAAYDDDLRLASLNVTGSAAVGYSYDADSLLTNVGSLGITRDPANGRVTATSQGTVTSSQTYNAYGELAGLIWSTSAGTLLGLDYGRDQLGRVTQATDSGTLGARTRTYTYDTAGRLTSADDNGAAALRVSYDDNSNPTSIQRGDALPVSASYDDQDRVLR
jgi:YD repeat-containing protein